MQKTLYDLLKNHHELWVKHQNNPEDKAVIKQLGYIEQQLEQHLRHKLMRMNIYDFLDNLRSVFLSFSELSDYTVLKTYKLLTNLMQEKTAALLADHREFVVRSLKHEGILRQRQ
ncbi:hypothetical protein J7L81_05310 [Candidatus Aerophobetes bacterium]|nr:hypothetical protein [Candidatus Aerophobetes bacterium]